MPVTKSTTGTWRGSPLRGHSVQTPSSAAVREIMAPAGSDMQTLPPTVAAFQILNDIRNAVDAFVEQRHGAPSRRPLEVVQLDDPAGRGDLQPGLRHRQRRPAELLEIDQRVGRDLWLGEQPGAASQKRMAIAPFDLVE